MTHLACRDAGDAECRQHRFDLARRYALDHGFLDDADQRLFAPLPIFDEARDEATLPKLWNVQLERPQSRIEPSLAIAIAVCHSLVATLVRLGSNPRGRLRFADEIQYHLPDLPDRILRIAGSLQ
jgi:hypothetical protein